MGPISVDVGISVERWPKSMDSDTCQIFQTSKKVDSDSRQCVLLFFFFFNKAERAGPDSSRCFECFRILVILILIPGN